MNILREVIGDLFKMFVADARMSMAIVILVALVALLIDAAHLPPLAGGLFLLAGCIIVLLVSVRRAAVQIANDGIGGS